MWRVFGRFRKINFGETNKMRRACETNKTNERLSAYIDGRLNTQEQIRLEQHLQTCQRCQNELDSFRATVGLLHQVPQASPSRSFRVAQVAPAPRWRALPVLRLATGAAAVLLVLAFTADLTNLFETTPQPIGQRGSSSSQLSPGESDNENDSSIGSYSSGKAGQDGGVNGKGELSLSAGEEGRWLRPLEYSLSGTVVVLGGAAIIIWQKSRRERAKEVSRSGEHIK